MKDKAKFWVVALALFLNPVFIDFFKDEWADKAGEHTAYQKIWISVTAAVTFLAGMYFWERSSENKSRRLTKKRIFFRQAAAIVLFLIPTLAMIGYLAREAAGNWNAVLQAASTPAKVIGVAGLLSVAAIGIGMSRFYEAPWCPMQKTCCVMSMG